MPKEYIERDELLTKINENPAEQANERCAQLIEAILEAPTINLEDCRPRGRWVSDESDVLFHCSECETQISTSWDYEDLHWHYCPNCGAKMDGKEQGE